MDKICRKKSSGYLRQKENKIGIRISAGYARASYAGIAAWQGLGFRGISV